MGPCPNMSPRLRRAALAGALAACLLVAGCEKKPSPLVLDDLNEGETTLLTRLIILERAKALALVDRPAGQAVLDSLAVAWGDSTTEQTLAGAPRDATRAHAVGQLYSRVFAAEHDSLQAHDGRRELTAPLPDPTAPAEDIGPEN